MFEAFERTVKQWVKQGIKPAIDRTMGRRPKRSWLTSISMQKFTSLRPASFDKPAFPSLA